MKNERMKLIAAIFEDDSPGFPKAEVLYRLAQEATLPIAEIGCAKGIGTTALAFGSMDGHNVPVFAIDPFTETYGWIGEYYGPELKDIWANNLLDAGVLRVVQAVMLPVGVLRWWPYEIGLTFWDIGKDVSDEEVADWLNVWCDIAIPPGGILAINETGDDNMHIDEWLDTRDDFDLIDVDYYIRIARKRD